MGFLAAQPMAAFQLKLGDSSIQLNQRYALAGIGEVQIKTVKFYVSVMPHTERAMRPISAEEYHLIDFAHPSSLVIPVEVGGSNATSIWIGVDSVTQVSGLFMGDLDPLKGMYWTWQSGYISLKVEGELFKPNGDATSFEYHLGGYRMPHSIYFPLHTNSSFKTFQLILNIEPFLKQAVTQFPAKVVSPGKDAYLLGELFAQSFYLLPHE